MEEVQEQTESGRPTKKMRITGGSEGLCRSFKRRVTLEEGDNPTKKLKIDGGGLIDSFKRFGDFLRVTLEGFGIHGRGDIEILRFHRWRGEVVGVTILEDNKRKYLVK